MSERTYVALSAGALGVAFIAAIAVAHCTGPPARYATARRPALSGDTPGGHEPLPEFGSASAELTFRGAPCRHAQEERQAVLSRDCREPENP